MLGSTSGNFTQQPALATTNYTITWPDAQGAPGNVLENDGTGALTWVSGSAAINWKQSAIAASTATIDIVTGGLLTIDGVTLSAGDRVVVKNGSTGNPGVSSIDNGIYIAAVGAWSRSIDMATGYDAEGSAVIVTQGTVNADTAWIQTNEPAIVGTDALAFNAFGSTTPASGATGDVQFAAADSTFNSATQSGATTSYNYSISGDDGTLSVGAGASATAQGSFTVQGQTGVSATDAGSAITVDTGDGNTTGAGGALTLSAGSGGATDASVGGVVSITAGTSTATNGSGGALTIDGGTGTGTGDSGDVTITANAAPGAGTDGQLTLGQNGNTFLWPTDVPAVGEALKVLTFAGNVATLEWSPDSTTSSAGNAGDVQYSDGAGGFVAATLSSYNFTDSATVPQLEVGVEAGTWTLQGTTATTAATDGGSMSMTSGDGNTTGGGGGIGINSGDGGVTGTGGDVTITSGAGGAISGNAGDITLTAGTAAGAGTDGDILASSLNVDIVATEASTSTTTGTVRIAGGLGLTGDAYGLTFNATSDVAMKKNIIRISDPLNKLLEIEGYEYEWKDDRLNRGKKQLGVIAQQLEKIGMQDIVTGDETQKAVNYLALIPLIIEAIKEICDDIYDE